MRVACCLLIGLIGLFAGGEAYALCNDGTIAACNKPNGCKGFRECVGGYWSFCEATGEGPPCSVCGRTGQTTCDANFQIVANSCAAAETCNACDDDVNGVADDGLVKCAFGPLPQLACSSTVETTVPYSFDTGDLTADASASAYQNNTDYSWKLVTNPFVSTVRLRFDRFTTELGNDTLTATNFETLSGAVPSGLRSYAVNGSGQSNGLSWRFLSNASVTFPGFAVDQARLLCGSSGSTTAHPLAIQTPVEGLLAGTGDTIFFTFPGGPNRLYLVLEGGPGDIDLYVNSGSRPQHNVYLTRSVTSGSGEAVEIPGNTSGQTLFAAVTSHSGAGSFRLRLLRASETHELHAGLGFTPGPGDFARLEAMLEKGQRRFFAMTEGEIVVDKINFHHFTSGGLFGGCDCGGYPCDICIYSRSGRAHYNPITDEIVLYAEDWDDPRVVAHELGHKILGLPDEYNDHNDGTGNACHGDDLCGHTAMARLSSTNICTALDHRSDPGPPGHVCASCPGNNMSCTSQCASCPTGTSPGWPSFGFRTSLMPLGTSDNSTYQGLTALGQFLVTWPR